MKDTEPKTLPDAPAAPADERLKNEAERDTQRAIAHGKMLGDFLGKVFGGKP